MSEELAHETIERCCEQLAVFADPEKTNPGIKRPGDEQTGRQWVHANGVRVETNIGIRVSRLCVCTKSLVRKNCGVQPVTHTNGTFCGGNVVVGIKSQHSGRSQESSEVIQCVEAEIKLRCSSCGKISATDPHFLSVCVMAAGDTGCLMKICKSCHDKKKTMATTTTVSVFRNAISLRYGAIANMGLPQNIAGHEHGRSRQSTLAILFLSLRIGRTPCCCYCEENLERRLCVKAGRRGEVTKQLVGILSCSTCGERYMHEKYRLGAKAEYRLGRQYIVCGPHCEAQEKGIFQRSSYWDMYK